jgi:hypothetical protein
MTIYKIYPCDLDLFGECPKHCQNCEKCVPIMEAIEEEEEEEKEV